MADYSDFVLARRMLDARDNNGQNLSDFLRPRSMHYLKLSLCAGLLSSCALIPAATVLSFFGIGIIAGSVVRDFGWLIGANRQWAFTVKIIDWDKVQKLAGGDHASS